MLRHTSKWWLFKRKQCATSLQNSIRKTSTFRRWLKQFQETGSALYRKADFEGRFWLDWTFNVPWKAHMLKLFFILQYWFYRKQNILSYNFIFRKQFYFDSTGLKIIDDGNPDNNSESPCIISFFPRYTTLQLTVCTLHLLRKHHQMKVDRPPMKQPLHCCNSHIEGLIPVHGWNRFLSFHFLRWNADQNFTVTVSADGALYQ
jgi:hypothetical protein